MDWQLLGYSDYPFSVNPISINTVDLFTGHSNEVNICKNILKDKNIKIIIEGARGIGTTSFANYLKFSSQKQQQYFAPRDEVSVEKNWNLETLLTAVISTIIREFEISHGDAVKKNKVFLEAKSLSYRISEAYNNFGVTAFSFGGNFGKSSVVTQPSFVPSTVLGYHLEDLGKLAIKLGYKNGILIQLNNLDVNIIHSEDHLEYLLNAARDYFQIENISWFLVGDRGLRSFITRKVDRLDDIISHEIFINPLNKKVYHDLINNRLNYYQIKKNTKFPISKDIFDYLYDVSDGRLRYIFGLIYALINRLHIGKLIQDLSMNLAKTTISELTKERLKKFDLSKSEEEILKSLNKAGESNVADLAKTTKKNRTYVSRAINKLLAYKLVTVRPEGNSRIYAPSLDAKIAYSATINSNGY